MEDRNDIPSPIIGKLERVPFAPLGGSLNPTDYFIPKHLMEPAKIVFNFCDYARSPELRDTVVEEINRVVNIPFISERREGVWIDAVYGLLVGYVCDSEGINLIDNVDSLCEHLQSSDVSNDIVDKINGVINLPVLPEFAERYIFKLIYSVAVGAICKLLKKVL